MTTVATSSEQSHLERARKYEGVILKELASLGQRALAEQLGVHESTVSRMKDGEFARFCAVLALLDLKVVPRSMKCFEPKEIEPYIQIAKQHLAVIRSIDDLQFGDAE